MLGLARSSFSVDPLCEEYGLISWWNFITRYFSFSAIRLNICLHLPNLVRCLLLFRLNAKNGLDRLSHFRSGILIFSLPLTLIRILCHGCSYIHEPIVVVNFCVYVLLHCCFLFESVSPNSQTTLHQIIHNTGLIKMVCLLLRCLFVVLHFVHSYNWASNICLSKRFVIRLPSLKYTRPHSAYHSNSRYDELFNWVNHDTWGHDYHVPASAPVPTIIAHLYRLPRPLESVVVTNSGGTVLILLSHSKDNPDVDLRVLRWLQLDDIFPGVFQSNISSNTTHFQFSHELPSAMRSSQHFFAMLVLCSMDSSLELCRVKKVWHLIRIRQLLSRIMFQ